MKIAVLSTPWIASPPHGYGGIELVVSNLTEGLVSRGHEVMLFATGDSETSAKLSYEFNKHLGNNSVVKSNPYFLLKHVHAFFKKVKEENFDIIHNNMQYYPMFFCDLQSIPFLHTLHIAYYKNLVSPSGHIDDMRDALLRFRHHPFVSISNSQREDLSELNYVKTIYNGIKPSNYICHKNKGEYLAWLGRITPNKGVDIAIEVSRKSGIPLKISGFVDEGEKEYFEEKIRPMLDSNIEFLGEFKSVEEKNALLGGAFATLFPIRWNEPFGLVMVESMASGTPVVALNKGSVSEVILDGKTGYVVESIEEMTEALKKIDLIDREYCHKYATSVFSIDVMVDSYLEVYNRVISKVDNK